MKKEFCADEDIMNRGNCDIEKSDIVKEEFDNQETKANKIGKSQFEIQSLIEKFDKNDNLSIKCKVGKKFQQRKIEVVDPLDIKKLKSNKTNICQKSEENIKMKNDTKCHICNKKFSRSYDIPLHIMTVHKGLKNHKCDFCDKYFSRPTVLNRHVKSVHEGQKHNVSFAKNLLASRVI